MSSRNSLIHDQNILVNRIQEELHRYVFNELPIHLIHLQSAQLCDRQTVLQQILPTFSALTVQDLPQGLRDSLLNPIPSLSDTANIHRFIRRRLRYAVLSDQWGEPEPPYGAVPGPANTEQRPGYYDVAMFCDIARGHDMEYAWVDSCCIDKASDAELNRSIRSMYGWYANSSICIAHLADATSVDDLDQDSWFRRGWTLMQLLAPEKLKFYDNDWAPLTEYSNDKEPPDVLAAIRDATSILPQELQQFDPKALDTYQISKRMRWAANRRTTLAEDRAYSLMGVFGVVMDVAYGEGGLLAFSRLFREIVHFSNSPEAVNWVGSPAQAALSLQSLGYPSSPDAFIGSNDIVGLIREDPITFASNGLSIKLLILPATLVSWETPRVALLKCFGVQVRADCLPDFKPSDPDEGNKLEFALGGWNFSTMDGRCKRSGDMVEAIVLCRVIHRDGSKRIWGRIPTQSFVRLELKAINLPDGTRWDNYMRVAVL